MLFKMITAPYGSFFRLSALLFFYPLMLSAQVTVSPSYVVPKQSGFDFKKNGDNFVYVYKWRDSRGVRVTTSFALHSKDVEKGNTEFSKVGKEADKEIARRLQKKADQLGEMLNAKVTVVDNDGLYSLRVEGSGLTRGAFQYVFSQVQEAQKSVVDDYLKEVYYSTETRDDKVLIRPDYKALVSRYKPVGKIVGASLVKSSQQSVRGLVQHALDFVQSIPYGRDMNDGADFQTPIGLLTDNMGDCDTKAVALGSILSNYGIGFVFLLTSDHLFMGIDLPKGAGDRSFSYGNKSYVLAEPAGEGFPLGTAYPDSLKAFQDNKLEVISFK